MFSGSLASAPVGSTEDIWETTKQNLLVINAKHKVKGEFGSIREAQKTRTGRWTVTPHQHARANRKRSRKNKKKNTTGRQT